MIFYDSMAGFDLQKPVTTINSAEMLLPVRWTGLDVVLGLALVHLLLLCSTMVLFQFKTRASSLGNAWQATAQVVSTETRAVVEEASAVRDKEVEAWARSSVFPEGRACNDVRCQEQNGDRGSKDVKDIGRFQASGDRKSVV